MRLLSRELYTSDGKRKYLTSEERDCFLKAANQHERSEVRTLCLVMAYTGCRISEALAMTADKIDLSNKTIIFRTLKQRDRIIFRAIPIPDSTLRCLRSRSSHQEGSEGQIWRF